MGPNTAFSLLAHTARRVALRYLVVGDRHTTVEELSQVLAADSATSVERVDHARIELVHNHIPRMEAQGVVEYDSRNGDVVLTESGEELIALVDTAEELTADGVVEPSCSKE